MKLLELKKKTPKHKNITKYQERAQIKYTRKLEDFCHETIWQKWGKNLWSYHKYENWLNSSIESKQFPDWVKGKIWHCVVLRHASKLKKFIKVKN